MSGEALDESGAGAMFARMSAERLRTRCLWSGLVLVASILVPYEIVGGHGIFVWSVLPELDPAARLAALAPVIAGIVLVLLGLRTARREGILIARPTSRAIAVIAAFVAANGAIWIGRRSSAWGVIPLPDSLTTRTAPFLAVFALTAAGVTLRFHPRARRAGSVVLWASLAAAIVFYVWPARGEVPAQTIARAVVLVATLPDVRFQIGYGMLLLLVLAPLVVALLGGLYVRRVPEREHPGLAIAAVWGMPALVLLFVYRGFLAGGMGAQTMATAALALVAAAVIAPLAAAIEVLGLGLTADRAEQAIEPGARPIVAGGVAAGVVAAILGASFVLGRPAAKGVDWKPGAPSAEWDKALGELLPSWQHARLVRDGHARAEQGTGAEAQVATRARARALVAAARAQADGKGFADALSTLADEVDDLELSGRAFGRLVADANDASRRASLPYYLDPSIRVGVTERGTSRLFYLTPYRVEEVHGWRVGGDRFATLLVSPMTGDPHAHLGFSRDQDPFALVVRSEVRWYASRFSGAAPAGGEPGAASDEGGDTCGATTRADQAGAVARCQAALVKLRERLGAGLEDAILAGTERHELQHQIDGPHLPLSSAVAELLAGFTEEAQDRANRELSAYVAEMTAKGAPPQLTLVHLFPFGVVARGGAEHRVAMLLLETLAGRKLRVGAREVDPEAYAQAFEAEVGRGDDELREAARRAYGVHFGVELAEAGARVGEEEEDDANGSVAAALDRRVCAAAPAGAGAGGGADPAAGGRGRARSGAGSGDGERDDRGGSGEAGARRGSRRVGVAAAAGPREERGEGGGGEGGAREGGGRSEPARCCVARGGGRHGREGDRRRGAGRGGARGDLAGAGIVGAGSAVDRRVPARRRAAGIQLRRQRVHRGGEPARGEGRVPGAPGAPREPGGDARGALRAGVPGRSRGGAGGEGGRLAGGGRRRPAR